MRRRTIQHWFPYHFGEVVGNDELCRYGENLVRRFRLRGQFGGDHALIAGYSRSGKSSFMDLVKRAIICDEFDFEAFKPCDLTCRSCNQPLSVTGYTAMDYRPKILAGGRDIQMNVMSVDCASTDVKELEDLLFEVRAHTGPTHYFLVHLEEVHWLGEKGLDQRLLVAMDSYPSVTWVATSAYVKKEDAKVRKLLDQMLLNRFRHQLSTRLPTVDALAIWLGERCLEFKIRVEDPKLDTLRLLAERAQQVPGMALNILARIDPEDDHPILERRIIK